jgi:hypothetical protein
MYNGVPKPSGKRELTWSRSLFKVGGCREHPHAVRELDLVDDFPAVVFAFEVGTEI